MRVGGRGGYPEDMTPSPSHFVHRPAELFFTGLARLRGAKAFHPRGTVAHGTLRLDDPASAWAAAFGTGERPVLARLSRGIGLPQQLPDILGIALRIPSDAGPVDVLVGSVAPGRLGTYVLLPSPRWTARRFSTLLPYVGPDGSVVLGLQAPGDQTGSARLDEARDAIDGPGLELDVLERPHGEDWRVVGRVRLDQQADPVPDGFDPVRHAHPALRLARPLTGLREAAYRGSRRGRGRHDHQIPVPSSTVPETTTPERPAP